MKLAVDGRGISPTSQHADAQGNGFVLQRLAQQVAGNALVVHGLGCGRLGHLGLRGLGLAVRSGLRLCLGCAQHQQGRSQ